MLQQRCREKRIIIILWFLLLLRNCIYNSESYLEKLGFTLKGTVCLCSKHHKSKNEACSALCFS